MTNDVRSACLSLVKTWTSGRPASRSPSPVALGWKLESGMVPAAEVEALVRSVGSTLNGANGAVGQWPSSAALRALMAEYAAVRRGAKYATGTRAERAGRRLVRPAGCA